MPCVIQIKDDITSTIEEMSGNYTNKTPSFIKILQNTINNRFKVPVVTFLKQTDDTFLSKIHIPQSLIDEYYKNELLIEGERDAYEKEKKSLKKGVLELFESNPELANIGTQEQYSQYIDTIFPDSKVKDIVYHHSDTKITEFKKEFPEGYAAQKGVSPKAKFFLRQPLKEEFLSKRPYLGQYLINIINPNVMPINADRSAKRDSGIKEGIQEALDNNQDGAIFDNIWDNRTWSDVLVVFKPEQIHILGSKEDIEGFKEFINNKNYNNKNTSDSIFNEYGVTHEEWNNASESEREMIIWQSKNNC